MFQRRIFRRNSDDSSWRAGISRQQNALPRVVATPRLNKTQPRSSSQLINSVKGDLAQAEFGVTGADVVWAVVGSGVDGQHKHFTRWSNLILPASLTHVNLSRLKSDMQAEDVLDIGGLIRSFTSAPVDPIGNGTAVAGIIAGERGIAPRAKITRFKVLDDDGKGSEFEVLSALQMIQYLNEQAGRLVIHGVLLALFLDWDSANFACGFSPICEELDRLAESGVVVVAAAGDRAVTRASGTLIQGSISDPGNAENAITVGATHRSLPERYGASYFSCRGPTWDGRRKPDLLAPGEKLEVCWPLADGGDFTVRDGTILAAAHVAGGIAALLSKCRDLAGSPHMIKSLLLQTAFNLGRCSDYQGAGLLDVAVGSLKKYLESLSPGRL